MPRVRRAAAQGVQRGRRGLQGLRLLPHRQPRGAASASSDSGSDSSEGLGRSPRRLTPTRSSGGSATKSETFKPAARAVERHRRPRAPPRPRPPDPVERPPAGGPVAYGRRIPSPRMRPRPAGTGSLVAPGAARCWPAVGRWPRCSTAIAVLAGAARWPPPPAAQRRGSSSPPATCPPGAVVSAPDLPAAAYPPTVPDGLAATPVGRILAAPAASR